MMFGFKVRRIACDVLAAMVISAVSSFAETSQFRGVNWADKRDNFVSEVLVLSGMSLSDNYQSASVVADRVIGQFQELFGTNSVRIPVNEPTILKFWDTYTGVIDMGLSKGRIVMGYWGPAQPSGPKNMNDWWSMWAKIVEKYGDHPNAYFEIFNEPHMYNKSQLRDLYAQWLDKFSDVPRDHILLDGSGMAQNVPDIADDPRFEGCLFAVHEYTFWNMSITTEQGWKNSFKGKVGKFADRTVCTEWGGAMSPGDKAGVHYDYMDYNSTPTNYFMAYIRGMSDQLREWEMGSFYWPGLRDGDWYSMTKRTGEGANIKLEIVNQSGVDRMKMAWADTVETTPLVREAYSGEPAAIPGVIEAENYDKGGNRFSFYDKDAANKGEMGCQKNGDDSSENFLVWRGDVFALNCPTITGQGHFQVTLDAVNFTYSIAPAKAYLYMAGDANKWSHVDALSSPSFNNIYKGYMYLNQNGFKFCTEANWNGTNYGADFSTAGDAGNIIMSEPEGFYQVIVDLNEKSYALTAISTIGLIGDATPGGWSEDTPMEYDKENRCWVVTTDIGEGEFKFRANKDWGINWGGEKDNLTQDGANLKEAPGRYTIKLYPLCEGMSHYTIEAAK